MTTTARLASGMTVAAYKDPNTLTPANPLIDPYNPTLPSAAWALQGIKALFPNALVLPYGADEIVLDFITSATNAIFTVKAWNWDRVNLIWTPPASNSTSTFTGNNSYSIARPGIDPWYLQLVSISAGTLTTNYNGQVATAY